jgi:phosphatidylglycerophosphatase C
MLMSPDMEAGSTSLTGVVVFDLDHTVSRYDTFKPFLLRLVKAHPTRLRYLPQLVMTWTRHQLGLIDNATMKNVFLQRLAGGLQAEELEAIAARHVNHLLKHGLYAEALDEIAQQREPGSRLLMATASPDIYAVALGQALGFDEVIASQLDWNQDSTCKGRLKGDNCYGEAKALRVLHWLEEHPGFTLTHVYSDHISDLPLFALAQQGVAVNAGPQLRSVTTGLALRHVRWHMSASTEPAAAPTQATTG